MMNGHSGARLTKSSSQGDITNLSQQLGSGLGSSRGVQSYGALPQINKSGRSQQGLPSLMRQVKRTPQKAWDNLRPGESVSVFRRMDAHLGGATTSKKTKTLTGASVPSAKKEEVEDDDSEPQIEKHITWIRQIYTSNNADDRSDLDDGPEFDPNDELTRLLDTKEAVQDEDEMLQEELSKLHTGEDVISFFARGNGANTPVKLLYCNRAPPDGSNEFRPYDLVKVADDEVNPEYFTISASGIVHICPGQLAESISLVDWMHQSLMFRVLTSMVFFKYYIHKKVFTQWEDNARYEVYCKQRRKLSRSCFLTKPLFVEPIVQVHALTFEVEKVKVMQIENNMTSALPLEVFYKLQMEKRSNAVDGAQKEFEQKHDAVVMIVDRMIATASRSIEADLGANDHGGKSKSMVQEKQEMRERARHQKIANHDYNMLGDCIRLVDYMFQSALVSVVTKAMVEFHHRIMPGNNVSKLFTISVAFGESMVLLDPPKPKFNEVFNRLWKDTIQVVNSVQSFTSVRQYEQHIRDRVMNPQSTQNILVHNNSYRDHTQMIMNIINDALDASQVFANDTYTPFRKIYNFGLAWSEEEFNSKEYTFDELEAHMREMRGFSDELEKNLTGAPRVLPSAPIISVDAKDLKKELTPIPENALNAMKKVLTVMAREKCQDTFQLYDTINKALDERPTELKKYAEYYKMYQSVQDNKGQWEEMFESVNTMYDLIKEFTVRIPSQDEFLFDGLKAREESFQGEKLEEAEGHIQAVKDSMINDNYQKSLKVEEEVVQIQEELVVGSFIDADKIATAHEVLEELDQIRDQKLSKLEEKAETYTEQEALLGVHPDCLGMEEGKFDFKELKKSRELFDQKLKLWEIVAQWQDLSAGWQGNEFSKVDVEGMSKLVGQFFRQIFNLTKAFPKDEVASRTKGMIEHVRDRMPVILDLGNPAMRPRHWEKIYKAINLPWKGPSSMNSTTLKMLEENGVFDHRELCSEMSATASGEFALEQSLEQVVNAWADLFLPVMNHRNQKDLWILGDLADIITLCEDHSVTVATMMGSRFIHGIREKVELWEKKINNSSDVIDEWYQVQRAWMYLENIFSAEDIQQQLPSESAKFKQVDKFWKDLFRKVRQSFKMAMEAFHIPKLLDQLKWANETLDQVQKKLEAYLETKRAAFPRFYFLSNDELLSILSQTRNPHAVQEHLCKCFDSISRVDFGTEPANKHEIHAMCDMIKERVPFVEPVITGPVVEKWLYDIEHAMVAGIHYFLKQCLIEYPEDGTYRTDWLLANHLSASQAKLAVDQIFWTRLTEEALDQISSGKNQNGMKDNIDFNNKQLANSVSIVRMDLTKLQRVLLGALIVLDVHGISVLQNLRDAGTSSVNDFDWSKQLRYYWCPEETGDVNKDSFGEPVENDCLIRQTIAGFRYSHEYLGNTPRLVVTPLTDKCYMTLTGAMHLNYGGAPAGPAGTGKTETTKDLGKALAVPVIVFNCSDGLDYKIMGRFFSGLAQAGAWACFDEFNRIQVEVLSVIAQQMLTVTQAIRQRKETFEFVGREIPLNMRFGVYITMNPGYAGRAELPDNLKALFRPVAMMVPDYRLIAEIILYSEGFNGAPDLARKMVSLYSLSSEQLSKQDHYDFGMRAVKSVLVMAGHLKRQNPDLEESITLVRALRDSNVPKFLSFDLPLFNGIITDLYPTLTIPNVDYGNLKIEIENQLRLAGLQIVDGFVIKITQLLETQLVRHGVMLVGLTMTGKSTDSMILSKTLTQLKKDGSTEPAHQFTKIFVLNPKSITMEELYGSFNDNTGEWKDGLCAILVREAISDNSDNKKWVNFDGPVDAIWIENMNTVLDDNKMLCLSNGERIKLPPTMCMMFEVNDLAVASPATVSRCGMVYLEPVHLGWKPLVVSWAEAFEKSYSRYAKDLGNWTTALIADCLPFIREECQEAPGIPTMDNNLTASYLRFMSAFISERHGIVPDGEGKPMRSQEDCDKLVRIYCAMSAIWSLGGNLHESSRKKFMNFVRPLVQRFCEQIPDDLDLFLSTVDDDSCQIKHLNNIVPKFNYDPNQSFFNILVPTAETTGQRITLENLMAGGFNALFSGETGVGKSVGIQQFLNTCGELFSTGGANFSAQTSTTNVGDLFENRLERKRKNLLGAPPGTTMLFFVDDINMPMLETYGAQPPIELLRQVIDSGGFYDQKKLFWKNVQDVQFISACGPPGGGKMPVTPRLFRHFNMMWMTALSEEAMNRILLSILSGWTNLVAPNLADIAQPIVKAGVEVFYKCSNDLLPTPEKCHYTFNLRDPAKMLQGMLMVNVKLSLNSEQDFINLFLHESCRQFRDRLVDDTDRDWFNGMIARKLSASIGRPVKEDSFKDKIFGDFLDRGARPYQSVESEQKCIEIFNEWLDDYNQTNSTKMDIVFFSDACHHLARCSRVIRQPRGNMLLVGISGVGRKCIGRMGAHMSEYQCYSIEITRTYGQNEFKEDIKSMMMGIAKSGGKGIMFLFSDTQIVKESFLEDINNILNTGEVPNLFAPDELEAVIGAMRPAAKAAGRPDSKDSIWQYFVQSVRENMHIVLAFSPIGDGFRSRCRQFPSIINCASIDWFSAWPADALFAVAERSYKAAPKELELEEIIPQLAEISQFMHRSSRDIAESFFDRVRRRTYMTPTSYLELLSLFGTLLGQKKGELMTKLQRYVVGTKTLVETKTVVDDLQVAITKMQPEIAQAQIDTAELVVKVDADKAIAQEKSEACAVDEKAAGDAAAEAGAIAKECQDDLDIAMPEYNEAVKSLDSLDKKDIGEIKTFAKPPPLVEVVLCAVCLLLGAKEDWDSAKKQMQDGAFLDKLKTYDKEALSNNAKLTAKLQKYIKRDDFVAEKVFSVSRAAASLCKWVKAMDIYGRVAREIEPKKEKLRGAEASRDKAQSQLAAKKAELQGVLDKVASLERQLKAAKDKGEELEAKAEDCVIKLNRAKKLLGGLGNESVRWTAASEVLEYNLKFVIGNIILASAFVAYSGAFTSEFRREQVQQWREKANELGLTCDPSWKCSDVLVDPAEVREWNICYLPADDLSVENGIMVTRGRRWPLMIDPQAQANRWVRTMGKKNKIIVTKLSDGQYLRKLESGIRNGNSFLIENVEEVLDPAIEPVLVKAIFKRGGQLLLRLGTEDVPYDENFAFYITTKMANPHYLPEVCIKVTIINFTVTLLGLEDQLVAEVVENERPDLAAQRAELVVQIAEDKKTQDDLEKNILRLLDEAAGDVLKDDSLNEELDRSATVGGECKVRMEVADKAMAEIEIVREKLRPVATRASILYFVIADFATIDPMYQYSLEFFVGQFRQRLQGAEACDDVDKRIMILINDFTKFIFLNICRGLFEDHKLLFSFLITAQILRNDVHTKFLGIEGLSATEWIFFLRRIEAGKGVIEDRNDEENPCPNFLKEVAWSKLDTLERLTVANEETKFSGLCSEIKSNKAWEKLLTSDTMYKEDVPAPWDKKLTQFEKMLIVSSVREDFMVPAIRGVVGKELGELFTESPPFDLAGAFNDSQATSPLIFVLSSGADPTEYLLALAQEKGYGDRLHFISLGQGQGPKAEALVKLGWGTGDWVCLQNCHLAASWMGKLEQIQESQDPKQINEDYRLWLTSMPSAVFPVPVLQNGIKITNEPPKGLRANMRRTFADLGEDVYECCPKKPRDYKKLLFGLSFFHAVILERRKFGPIGWNIPYEWMDSDFQVSREQVRMYLENQADVLWITLRYIIAEVNYGGRVTDDKDVRLISAVLGNYFNEDMLVDGYCFNKLPAYTLPNQGSLAECRELLRKFPVDEDPRIFGLHQNAMITSMQSQAKNFMDTVISVQPRISSSGGGGKKPEEIVDEMAAAFLERIPDPAKKKFAHAETYKETPEGGIVSLGVFHDQEYTRLAKMIGTIKASLKNLQKAIKGIILMGADLEAMYNCFMIQKVPPNWIKVAYPCMKPLNSWVEDFILRINFMAGWLTQGPPKCYWISCFFFPQGFMTAALQVHARKTKIAIDTLAFFSSPTQISEGDDVTERPDNGVNIHGLFLQGCGWDIQKSLLRESLKDILFEPFPVILLDPIPLGELQPRITTQNLYMCPIYKTSERKGTLSTTGHSTNFVKYFMVGQPEKDPSHWTTRGVAMLCMLDD
jgi:dynein heavy chain